MQIILASVLIVHTHVVEHAREIFKCRDIHACLVHHRLHAKVDQQRLVACLTIRDQVGAQE